jgi:hypothetical protein
VNLNALLAATGTAYAVSIIRNGDELVRPRRAKNYAAFLIAGIVR